MENGEKGRAPSLDDVVRAVLPEDMPMHPDHPMQQDEPAPSQYSDVASDGGMDPRNAPAQAHYEQEAVVVVGYAYDLESGAYSQYPGEDWSALMTVAQHERIVASLTRPAQTEQRPIRLPQRADTSHGDAFDTQLAEAYNAALDEVARLNAAPIAQTAPQPEQSGLYTCIGKGGSYELIGRATTAGALKVTGRFADEVIVYRDTKSNALYCREPGDFRLRMARAALSTQGGSDE